MHLVGRKRQGIPPREDSKTVAEGRFAYTGWAPLIDPTDRVSDDNVHRMTVPSLKPQREAKARSRFVDPALRWFANQEWARAWWHEREDGVGLGDSGGEV